MLLPAQLDFSFISSLHGVHDLPMHKFLFPQSVLTLELESFFCSLNNALIKLFLSLFISLIFFNFFGFGELFLAILY